MTTPPIGRALLSGLLALMLGTLAACDEFEDAAPAAAANRPPPGVVVTPVIEEAVAGTAEFVGRTEAFEEVDLRARVQGFLVERPFVEGDVVERGATLFVIDPAEYQAEVMAAEAEIERARAQHEAALNEVERARQLIARGNISESELDKREAEANRLAAEIKAGQAALEQARLDVGYTRITAPISGRIGRSAFDPGNLIGPESGVLATVVRLDPIYVSFPVSEKAYLQYMKREDRPELTPKIRLSDGSMYQRSGEVDFVDNRIDPTTGTIQVRTTFANPDSLLLPGQYVTVVLAEAEPDVHTVIPQVAVQENQAGRFVLVVDDQNRVEARPVTMGQRVGTNWVVLDGLREGELVIVEGMQKVRPGGVVVPTYAGAGPQA
jgi:membrane fusion protein (multidrug efflux system)